MASSTPAAREQRRFRLATAVVAGAALVFALLLSPLSPPDVRESASGGGLVLAAVVAVLCGVRRIRVSATRREALPWWLLLSGAAVAILGNFGVAVTGGDTFSSSASFVPVALSMLLCMLAILAFPVRRPRGAEQVVMLLDGLVAGGAFLLIASVLAFSELLESSTTTTTADRVTGIAFPALDVLLATVAVLLVVRAPRDSRLMLSLVASGFLLYAASDLSYAARSAQGTFELGSLWDFGWIAGWLVLVLASWTPLDGVPQRRERDRLRDSVADALGTTLVFSVLVVATVVQVLFGGRGDLQAAQSALWVVIVVAAGIRQVLLTVDNTALRRGLERRVQEQTADLRRLARANEVLVTSVGDGVYGVDHQGRVTFLNPSAAEALGYSAADLLDKRAHDVFHAPTPEGAPYPWTGCYVHEAITHGLVSSAENDEYVRADGTRFPVEITAAPLLDDNEVRGAVVVFRDVTQRREVERLKDEFLSVVSHELRTPLTSIRGSLGLLAGGRMGELPGPAAQLITVASQSTDRLTRLINDLLDIERMESGSRPMEINALDARYLLDSAVHQIAGLTSQYGVQVVVDETRGRVLADEDRVIQTLLNLLGNAVKFSERGSTVRLDAFAEGEEVHFRVCDNGRGIPADKLESIFERFQQVDSSDTRQKGGTGLGLAISKGIIERHGGRIWAESELGVGTTVHFTLPAAARLSDLASSPPPGAGAPAVLVCDDDAGVVEHFVVLLREHGYRPIGVTDGAEALGLVAAEHPSAVVLDLMMPGTTGADVMAALRSDPATRHIPVVVISGLGPEVDEHVAQSAESWLIKPVSEERLVTAVSMALEHAHAEADERLVLLVEDDEGLAEVVATLLGHEGLRVVRASSAAEAIARGGELRPDVIVLDIRLPDGDGSEVVSAFSERWSLAHTPVVVYSAVDVDPDRRDDLRLGRTVFLTKGRTTPEQLRDEVLSLVGAVARHHGARREEQASGVDAH